MAQCAIYVPLLQPASCWGRFLLAKLSLTSPQIDVQPARSATKSRRLETLARIERAALSLIVERGFDRVTIDALSQASGISRRTIYRHFRSTEDVLYQALCKIIDAWIEAIETRSSGEPLVVSINAANRTMGQLLQNSEREAMTAAAMLGDPELILRLTGPIQSYIASKAEILIIPRLPACYRDEELGDAIASGLAATVLRLLERAAMARRPLRATDVERALTAFSAFLVGDPS